MFKSCGSTQSYMSHFLLELPFFFFIPQAAVFIGLVPIGTFFLLWKPVAESLGTNCNPLRVSVELLRLLVSHSSTIFDLFCKGRLGFWMCSVKEAIPPEQAGGQGWFKLCALALYISHSSHEDIESERKHWWSCLSAILTKSWVFFFFCWPSVSYSSLYLFPWR